MVVFNIPVAPIHDQARKHNESLPGMGGVFNVVNLHVYHYAGNNPVKYVDPDGNWIETGWDVTSLAAGIVAVAGVASTATGQIYITPGAAALSKSLFLTGTSILALDTANDIATANSQKAPSVLGNRFSVSVSSPNPIPPDDDKDKKDRQRTSPNQMNQQVKKGKAPKSVDRVYSANTNVKGEQDHIHFKDGNALNKDGSWKEGLGRSLTNTEKQWIIDNNWTVPMD